MLCVLNGLNCHLLFQLQSSVQNTVGFFSFCFKGERKVQKEVAIQGYSKQLWQKNNNSVVQAVKLGHPVLFAAYVYVKCKVIICC